MGKPEYRPMMVTMAAMTTHHLLMLTATNDGDDNVYIDLDGHQFSTKDVAKGKPLNARKWALEQAIAYAVAHPKLKATEADILAGAGRFLEWLEAGKPTERPSQLPPKEGGITFA